MAKQKQKKSASKQPASKQKTFTLSAEKVIAKPAGRMTKKKAAPKPKAPKKAAPKPKAAPRPAKARATKATPTPETVVERVEVRVEVPTLFPVDLFVTTMRQCWSLGRQYGSNISADQFARYMRLVLETGSDRDLESRIRQYGSDLIRHLIELRHLVGTPPLPGLPDTTPSAAAANNQSPNHIGIDPDADDEDERDAG